MTNSDNKNQTITRADCKHGIKQQSYRLNLQQLPSRLHTDSTSKPLIQAKKKKNYLEEINNPPQRQAKKKGQSLLLNKGRSQDKI